MRRVGIIADDSMMGRDTPSRGLELTAQYVADQFRGFGLKPGGDSGTWFQRYPITRRQLRPGQSEVVFQAGGAQAERGFDRTRALVQAGGARGSRSRGRSMLLGGPLTPDAVGRHGAARQDGALRPDYRERRFRPTQPGACGRSGWPGRGA